MSSLLFSCPDIFHSYKVWVSKNPQSLGDWENSAKWVSYFIAGRINNSHILSELVYCLSNLLVMFNDRIIKKTICQVDSNTTPDKIKLWLTVIEYSEVFCELSASKIWGSAGKWVIVTCIQVFKCIARLFLVYQHKEPIIQNPPIPVLDRRDLKSNNSNYATMGDLAQEQLNSVSFTLKRSGRVVRKVDSAPPLAIRNWKPLLKAPSFSCGNNQTIEQSLAGRQLIAETIYISKPLVHLLSMACFGTETWKPWMIGLALDLTSLQLYRSCRSKSINSLTPLQRLQLSRRTVILVLYLLRSPIYERYSKDKIDGFLKALSKIPLAGLICTPLAQYLPFWQSTYFYMWST
ncbi:peroxisomal biogenesis factor 16 [Leptinotarsa decemlineata]|uniref:peroxisomal biogenesis factor 16 n=1 Tax=Leptinotarsa decemlineata TaxID=7539 RepID=UPI003D304487